MDPNSDRDIASCVAITSATCVQEGDQITVQLYAGGRALFDGGMLATESQEFGDVRGQIEDDLGNNAEIDDETLIRVFSFECREGESEHHFEDDRLRLENALCDRALSELDTFLAARSVERGRDAPSSLDH